MDGLSSQFIIIIGLSRESVPTIFIIYIIIFILHTHTSVSGLNHFSDFVFQSASVIIFIYFILLQYLLLLDADYKCFNNSILG